MKILVFPCGSEIGLEIHRSLNDHVSLIGGSSLNDHGHFVYKNIIHLPFINDENFIDELKKVEFDFLYPANDSVIQKICQTDIPYIGSCKETCLITLSKKKTHELFPELSPKANHFPLFLKPDFGTGAKRCFVANDKEELDFYMKRNPDLLSFEYLTGKEYTVDCFTDFKGNLRYVGARERRRMSNGLSSNAISVVGKEFDEIAELISSKLKFNGAWFFQVKRNEEGVLKLLEIAPRIGGSSCLTRLKGVNLPHLSHLNQMNIDVEIEPNDLEIEIDRAYDICYKTKASHTRTSILKQFDVWTT